MAPIRLLQQAVPTLVVVMALVQDVTFAASVPGQFNPEVLRNMPLTGLTNSQTVYWSVQAVDTAFAGGPFATESSVASLPALTTDRGNGTNAIV